VLRRRGACLGGRRRTWLGLGAVLVVGGGGHGSAGRACSRAARTRVHTMGRGSAGRRRSLGRGGSRARDDGRDEAGRGDRGAEASAAGAVPPPRTDSAWGRRRGRGHRDADPWPRPQASPARIAAHPPAGAASGCAPGLPPPASPPRPCRPRARAGRGPKGRGQRGPQFTAGNLEETCGSPGSGSQPVAGWGPRPARSANCAGGAGPQGRGSLGQAALHQAGRTSRRGTPVQVRRAVDHGGRPRPASIRVPKRFPGRWRANASYPAPQAEDVAGAGRPFSGPSGLLR